MNVLQFYGPYIGFGMSASFLHSNKTISIFTDKSVAYWKKVCHLELFLEKSYHCKFDFLALEEKKKSNGIEYIHVIFWFVDLPNLQGGLQDSIWARIESVYSDNSKVSALIGY